VANAQRYGSGLWVFWGFNAKHFLVGADHDALRFIVLKRSMVTTNFIAACAVDIWAIGLKRLKTAAKACPETLCVPANSPLYRRTIAPNSRYTRAPQYGLSQQTKPLSRQSVCSASASHQGCGLWRVWALGISERRCLSAASFDVHPQWPYTTKLPRRGRSPARRGTARALAQGDQLRVRNQPPPCFGANIAYIWCISI
jgi:hypothetical protein